MGAGGRVFKGEAAMQPCSWGRRIDGYGKWMLLSPRGVSHLPRGGGELTVPPPPWDGVFSGIVVNVGVYPPIFTSNTRLIFMFYFSSPVPETGLMVRPGGIGQHGNLFDL